MFKGRESASTLSHTKWWGKRYRKTCTSRRWKKRCPEKLEEVNAGIPWFPNSRIPFPAELHTYSEHLPVLKVSVMPSLLQVREIGDVKQSLWEKHTDFFSWEIKVSLLFYYSFCYLFHSVFYFVLLPWCLSLSWWHPSPLLPDVFLLYRLSFYSFPDVFLLPSLLSPLRFMYPSRIFRAI